MGPDSERQRTGRFLGPPRNVTHVCRRSAVLLAAPRSPAKTRHPLERTSEGGTDRSPTTGSPEDEEDHDSDVVHADESFYIEEKRVDRFATQTLLAVSVRKADENDRRPSTDAGRCRVADDSGARR